MLDGITGGWPLTVLQLVVHLEAVQVDSYNEARWWHNGKIAQDTDSSFHQSLFFFSIFLSLLRDLSWLRKCSMEDGFTELMVYRMLP